MGESAYTDIREQRDGAPAPAGPLANHDALSTADIDEFRSRASELLSTHSIRRSDTGAAPFDGHVRVAGLGDLRFVYLEQGVGMDVDILERIDYYDLMLAVSGTNRLTAGDDRAWVGDGRGAVLSPRMRARMQMDADYRQIHLRIDPRALDRRLEALLGRPPHAPLTFDLPMDLTSPRLSTWTSSLRLLLRDLDQADGLSRHPLAAATWQDMVLTGLLLAQPHSYSAALAEPGRPQVHRRELREAIDFCEAHLTEPLTIGEIARHVGVSVRSLQRAFQEGLGTSPGRYLQSLRLARVRRDLLDADPGSSVPVTEVAYRWGFVHLSRFAAAYRRQYGELPSDTRSRAIHG
ncbi:AraC family transcriptional regulator [Rhodococcus olei]|uniref:AraC family transcriptional regulator n=1 Tax=Rhodococcus olei TaxID=2161675 RepID=A0ABP8P7Y5_9NOCA